MSNLENEKQKLLLFWKANYPSLVMKTTVMVAAAVAVVAVAVAAVPATLLAIQVLEQD